MKAGQITSWICNYGNILQCYATQVFFQKKGIDTELLVRKESGLSRILAKLEKCFRLIIMCIAHPSYIAFFYRFLTKSKRRYSKVKTNSQVVLNNFRKKWIKHRFISYKKMKEISKTNEYDFFFCGSDQIWNPYNVFLEKVFFLRFCPNNKRVAFAPSFGCTNLPPFNKKKIIKYLRDFEYYSVREKTGEEIIKKHLGKDAFVLGDPVLLISKDDWTEIIEDHNSNSIQDKYVLLYFLDEPSIDAVESIAEYAVVNRTKIVIVGDRFSVYDKIGDVLYPSCDPFQFLSYINGAFKIFTDSFHGTVFSTIFNRQFYCFNRNYGHINNQSTRIVSFLQEFGLDNRFIEHFDRKKDFFIEYEFINKKIESFSKRSNSWIDNFICSYQKNDD